LDRDSGQVYREDSDTRSTDINHRFNARIDYKITDRTSLLIRPRFSIQLNDGTENTLGSTSLGNNLLNQSNIDFGSDLQAWDVNSFILLRHRFEKRGRTISVFARTGYKDQMGDNRLLSGLNYFSEPASLDSVNQISTLDSKSWTLSTNITYTEPLGRRGMLQFRYSYSPQWNDSETLTNNFNEANNSYNSLDSILSNTFKSTYTAHQAGPGIMIRKGRDLMLNVRVNAQYAILNNDQVFPFPTDIDKNFFSVLPSAFLRYRISKQKNLRFIYRASTNPPSLSQLQEVLDNSNPLQLSIGNPELKQSFAHMLMLRYNSTNTAKGSVFYFMLNGNISQNYVGNQTIIPNRNTVFNGIEIPRGSQLTSPVNLDGNWSVRSFLTYGRPVPFLKSNLNINLSGDYSRRPSLINDLLNETQTVNAGIGLVLASNFSENVDFTISSRSNVNRAVNSIQETQNNRYFNQNTMAKLNLIFWGGFVLRSQLNHQLYRGLSDDFDQDYWLWSGSFGRKFLKDNKGELMLNVFDLLRQNTSIQRNVNDFFIEDLSTVVLQRYVMLTFTYQFRKFKAGEIKQEERRRRF
ncbi:MAG: outer membrane beta-barrel protein, partial [Bacteroidota bacterium]